MTVAGIAGVAALLVATPGCGQVDESAQSGATLPTSTLEATELPDPSQDVTNRLDEVDAGEALALARAALADAASFRVSGSPTPQQTLDLVFVAGTRPVGGEPPSRVDAVEVEPSPRGVQGELTLDGATFSLVVADGAVYVRGHLDWLADEIDDSAQRTVGGKWLLLPESLAAGLDAFVDPKTFAEALLDPVGEVHSVGVSSVEGMPSVGVRWVDTEATAWLSGVDEPYPLLVERFGATASEGVLRFSEFDEPVTLAAPEESDVVVAPAPPDSSVG